MKYITLIICTILFLGGCSPQSSASPITENQLDQVVFTYQGNDYQAKYYIECMSNEECQNFNEDETQITTSLEQLKQAIKPGLINAKSGDKVKIEFPEGLEVPDNLSYQELQNGASSEPQEFEESIVMEGTKDKETTYIIHASWEGSDGISAAVKFMFVFPPQN